MLVPWYTEDGKLWRMPAQFISATPDQALDCDETRIDACYDEFLCTVCGDPVATIGDGTGWLLGRSIIGGVCCTRCAWLSVLSCPRLKEDGEKVPVWTCRSKGGYRWMEERSMSVGHVVATEQATVSSYAELATAFKQLKQSAAAAGCPAHAD